MCTVLPPLGDNPIAVNKYIISEFIKYLTQIFVTLESVNHCLFVPVMTQENTHTHMQTSVLEGQM
jgi:hypothetical protein